MKKIKRIILIVLLATTITTGCTKSFVDEDTKKSYTSNILCKPTEEERIEIYEKASENNKLSKKLEEYPECNNLKINSGGYEGLWTSIFVKPLAWLIVKVGLLVKNYGISIMLLGVMLRLLVLPLSKKTIDMSENMKKAQPELAKIEKKYANRTDNESMSLKTKETMLIYKKYNINPGSGCIVSLIQLPLFFAFLEAIQRIPVILEETTFGLYLGITPWDAIVSGKWYYGVLVIAIGFATFFSLSNTNNSTMNSQQASQTKTMSIFMVVFITFMSFTLNVGIGLYWFATSAFAIIQNLLLKKLRK